MAATTPAAAVLGALGAGASEPSRPWPSSRRRASRTPRPCRFGEGDRRLLGLALELSARDIELVVSCPACKVPNAADLRPEDLPPLAPRVAWLGEGGLRAPTFADLEALPAEPGAAVGELLAAARSGSGRPPRRGRPRHGGRLPLRPRRDRVPGVLGGHRHQGENVERLALLRLGECARDREADVHALAAAYHWTLDEIESLPDGRRRRLASLAREGLLWTGRPPARPGA